MKGIFISILVFSGLLVGCYKEETIHGREGGEPFYTLPQGNHAYDKDIVIWFENYGFYTLYDFKENDLYWNNDGWEQSGMLDYGLTGKLSGYKADTNYVGKQLDWFQKLFLLHYPEDFIAQGMPLKVLLCSKLQTAKNVPQFDEATGEYWFEQVYTDIWARRGYDYIAINGGNEWMKNFSDSLKSEFSSACNTILLRLLGEKGVLQNPPAAFFDVSSEFYGKYFSGGKGMFEYGFLTGDANKDNVKDSQYQDFLDYLSLAGYSLSVLNGEPGTSDNEYLYPSLRGVFNVNQNGLVLQKYNILMEWLRTKGIDVDGLQRPEDIE